MLSFRKKILFSDLILFLVFIALLFPFVEKTVENIVRKSLEFRTEKLIEDIKKAPSTAEMSKFLKDQELYTFFRISLMTQQGEVLYDSHIGKVLGTTKLTPYFLSQHPELQQAMKFGSGYSEAYSKIFEQSFAYVAKSFEYQGKTYIIRTAFPLKQITELIHDFEIGFLTLGAVILLLYSIMTWAIIHRLSHPIQKIIEEIKPYQEGKLEFLPHIELDRTIDKNDDFGRLANTLNSLTDRIQGQIHTLTKERNENESILESLVEGVIAVDSENMITYANAVACTMLSNPRISLVGQAIEDIREGPAALIEKCKEMVVRCQQKSEVLVESLKLGQSRTIYLDIIAAPKAYRSGAILVFQDRTSDFRVLQMGKDFVANASHELRTPITIIRGFAETLQDAPHLSREVIEDSIGKIVKTCHRLDSLVRNLLTLTDLENIPLSNLQPCELEVFLGNCMQNLLSLHPDTRISLEKEEGRYVIAAEFDLMEYAIMNLLENAVKYSNPPATILIRLRKTEKEVFIDIEDQGIGIPPQDLEHVFERFFTVDKARSRRFGGAGLGLSIVKTIIQNHSGKINVVSTIGVGSTFCLEFPVYKQRVLQGDEID